jgi:hypothetical protein
MVSPLHLGDGVALAEDDPTVGAGIVGLRGEHDHSRSVVAVEPLEHSLQGVGFDERRIAVEHEHRAVIAFERLGGLKDGVAGALLLGLVDDRRSAPVECLLDLVTALADDDDALAGADPVDTIEQVQEQRPRGDRVEDLVRIGAHPGALPGGEDHDGKIGDHIHLACVNGTGHGTAPVALETERAAMAAALWESRR